MGTLGSFGADSDFFLESLRGPFGPQAPLDLPPEALGLDPRPWGLGLLDLGATSQSLDVWA